jgi:hypothetical protein
MIFTNHKMNLMLVSENGQPHYHFACIDDNLINTPLNKVIPG